MAQTKSILLQLPLQKRLQFKEAVRKQILRDNNGITFQEKFKNLDCYPNLGSVIVSLLSWGKSKQGEDYWTNIYLESRY